MVSERPQSDGQEEGEGREVGGEEALLILKEGHDAAHQAQGAQAQGYRSHQARFQFQLESIL
jgi:hypothetical protein